MSDLNPKGVELQVNGERRYLLFTLNAVDRIQSDMEVPVFEVLLGLGRQADINNTIKYLIGVLLEDEAGRAKALEGKELRTYTDEELGWIITMDNLDDFVEAVLKAYGISMPKPGEDDDPNQQGGNMN